MNLLLFDIFWDEIYLDIRVNRSRSQQADKLLKDSF